MAMLGGARCHSLAVVEWDEPRPGGRGSAVGGYWLRSLSSCARVAVSGILILPDSIPLSARATLAQAAAGALLVLSSEMPFLTVRS